MKRELSSKQLTTPPRTQPTAYQPPRVSDLGAWQAVTLIYSVPFNGKLFPQQSGS